MRPGSPVSLRRGTGSVFPSPPSKERVMQQVKIFKSIDSELADMESEINQWIRKSGARVLSITGNMSSHPGASQGPLESFAASDVLVIVLYEADKSSA